MAAEIGSRRGDRCALQGMTRPRVAQRCAPPNDDQADSAGRSPEPHQRHQRVDMERDRAEADVQELRATLKLAREVQGRVLLIDGCFAEPDATLVARLRALHDRSREVAEELEALCQQRQADADREPGICVRCKDAPDQWGGLCSQCVDETTEESLRSSERIRATAAHRASMSKRIPTLVPWGETA